MKKTLNWLVNTLLFLTALAYPLLWLWLANSPLLQVLPFALALLWAVKIPLQAVRLQRIFAFFMAALLLLVGLNQQLEAMYWYPVLINAFMLLLFGSSLFQSQTLIERLARLQQPNLSAAGVRYTRRVTQLWCGVFLLNGGVATGLIWLEQWQAWAWYNGLVSYLIVGLVMTAEWLVRQRVKKQHKQVKE